MTPDTTQVLVSFCNLPQSTGERAVIRVNAATGAASPVDLGLTKCLSSCTGLATDGSRVYALAIAEDEQHVSVLDSETLEPVFTRHLPEVRDAHSVAVNDGELLIVSTGTDEIWTYPIEEHEIGPGRVAWKGGDVRGDINHLNSIVCWEGRWIISAFGPKSGQTWDDALDGFLHDITHDRRLKDGIHHPHTLSVSGSHLYYLASKQGLLCSLDGPLVDVRGYARGLCWLSERVACVGISQGRQKSRSTGLPLDNPEQSFAGLAVVDATQGRILKTVPLNGYNPEIFDILQLKNSRERITAQAPMGFIGTPGPSALISARSVLVEGWAILPGTFVDAVACADGEWVRIRYGLERSDVAAIHPELAGSRYCGFRGEVVLRNASSRSKVQVALRYSDWTGDLKTWCIEQQFQSVFPA